MAILSASFGCISLWENNIVPILGYLQHFLGVQTFQSFTVILAVMVHVCVVMWPDACSVLWLCHSLFLNTTLTYHFEKRTDGELAICLFSSPELKAHFTNELIILPDLIIHPLSVVVHNL